MPRSAEELLPRSSSQDFQQEDLGEPVLDTELHPGSLLYMPRGAEPLDEALAILTVSRLHFEQQVCSQPPAYALLALGIW